MPQRRVVRRLVQALRGRVRSSVVADEVEVLPGGRRDAKGLLHQAVRFISIPVRPIVTTHLQIRVASTSAVRSFASSCGCHRWCKAVSAPLSFHLSVCQETARHPTRAP